MDLDDFRLQVVVFFSAAIIGELSKENAFFPNRFVLGMSISELNSFRSIEATP